MQVKVDRSMSRVITLMPLKARGMLMTSFKKHTCTTSSVFSTVWENFQLFILLFFTVGWFHVKIRQHNSLMRFIFLAYLSLEQKIFCVEWKIYGILFMEYILPLITSLYIIRSRLLIHLACFISRIVNSL